MNKELRQIFKDSYSKLFAALYNKFRNIDLVEDAIQSAFEKALGTWTSPPDKPASWLYTTARNKAIDILKSKPSQTVEFMEQFHESPKAGTAESELTEGYLDEQLKLMCLCCHPALGERVQIILTLKFVAGFTTDEIASALIAKPGTIAQSLTRAKKKIQSAGIPFDMPDESALLERKRAIRSVIYLMFNEGYHSNSTHSLYRTDLCGEAIRICRLLCTIEQTDPEDRDLLTLMLFQHSRSKARSTADGMPVLLEKQNRKLWNMALIREADTMFARLPSPGEKPAGVYWYQAAIARLHSLAEDFASTDWKTICLLYSELYYLSPDPVLLLSWVSAESQRSNPQTALELIEKFQLEKHLSNYRWFYSTRAELRVRTGDNRAAAVDFEKALSLNCNPGERLYLQQQLGKLAASR